MLISFKSNLNKKKEGFNMCEFLSAIVMLNGDIVCRPQFTDSHEDLISSANIRDGLTQADGFVRVEFLPPSGSTQGKFLSPSDNSALFDTKSWTLKVDQPGVPDWFNKERARSSLAARVRRMFVQDERKILLGGCYILGDGADIEIVKNARIFRMVGNSKVGTMCGTSKVEFMCDSSKVGFMYDSSKVGVMRNSSKIGRMRNSSKVEFMYDSSKVETMYDSSQVERMFDSSKVGGMCGSSKIIEEKR